MKKLILFAIINLIFILNSFGQLGNNSATYYFKGTLSVGKGNTLPANSSSLLEVGNGSDNKGIVFPRIPNVNSVSTPIEGLFAYETNTKTLRYFDGTQWKTLSQSSGPTTTLHSGNGIHTRGDTTIRLGVDISTFGTTKKGLLTEPVFLVDSFLNGIQIITQDIPELRAMQLSMSNIGGSSVFIAPDGSTNINSSSGVDIRSYADKTIAKAGNIYVTGDNVYVGTTTHAFQTDGSNNRDKGLSIPVNPGPAVYNDNINSQPINYGGDYSSNFINNSLVSKKYVDQAISTSGGNFIPLSQKGTSNGVATLNSNSKVPLSQINDSLVRQGGNTLGQILSIGTNDNFNINFRVNGIGAGGITSLGNFNSLGFYNGDQNAGFYSFDANGSALIKRNKVDAFPIQIVNQSNNSGTGSMTSWRYLNTPIAEINSGGRFLGEGIANLASTSNAYIGLPSTGVLIQRNVADANATQTVNNNNASSTGLISDFRFQNVTKASIDRNGNLGLGVAIPSNRLDVKGGNIKFDTVVNVTTNYTGSYQVNSIGGGPTILNASSGIVLKSTDLKLNFTGTERRIVTIDSTGFLRNDDILTQLKTNDTSFMTTGSTTLTTIPTTTLSINIPSGLSYAIQVRTFIKNTTSPAEVASFSNAVVVKNDGSGAAQIGSAEIFTPIQSSGLTGATLTFSTSGNNLLIQTSVTSGTVPINYKFSIIVLKL